MTSSHPTIYTESYNDSLTLLAQQTQPRLRPFVRPAQEGTGETFFWDRLAATAAIEVTDRFAELTFADPEFTRVGCTPRPFAATGRLSERDILRGIIDPTNAVLQNMVASLARQFDLMVYQALGADVKLGRSGASTEALPAAQKIAVNSHAFDADAGSGDVGLTYYKMLSALAILRNAGIDPLVEDVVLACTATQKMDLVSAARGSSRDYVSQMPLETGALDLFLGVKLIDIVPEAAEALSGGDRFVYMFAKRGVGGAVLSDIKGEINKDPKALDAFLLKAWMDMDFARIDPKMVVQIACNV